MADMTQAEIERRIEGLDEETQKRMVCALAGHSRIVETCFGYIHCARCGDHIGDMLGGASTVKENVIMGHNCDTCRANFGKLNWRDTFMAPEPFATGV